ncbi:MAG: hypothetical protein LBR82_01955 [Desulfovibrio sp.]|jgi:hypothetical protein|nr:hypothetical protein [Desulfovibrio sp.]
MPAVIVGTFAGEVPRLEPGLLETQQASRAVNCTMDRGSLRALRGPSRVANLPAVSGTIYKHPQDGWLGWSSDKVSVVPSAVIDVDGDAPLGHLLITGEREYPTQRLAGGDTCRLGLPRPSTAPELNRNEMSAAGTVRVMGYAAPDYGDVPGRYGEDDQLLPIVPSGGTLTATLELAEGEDQGISRSTIYCYTYVRYMADGVIQQESAPSPPSVMVDVLDGDGVTVGGFVLPTLDDVRVTHIRIYRTVGGTESGEFRFVAEIPATQTEYEDTAHDKDIDVEVLRTSLWDAIPDDAQGLIKTDNGIYAAFRGNELLVSEPYIPYAFPDAYRLTVEDKIVALSHVDNTIVILTEGRPYLAQGQAPESLQLIHLPIEQSCVSARSVSTLPGGVIFASPDGLMLFSANEQTLLTGGMFTREQWQELGPADILGAVSEDQYIAFSRATGRGFVYDFSRKDVVRLDLPDVAVHALYRHTGDDCLYLSMDDGTPGVGRYGDGEHLTFTWRSKAFFTSALVGMTALRVTGGQRPGNRLLVTVYGPHPTRARARLRLTDSRTKRITATRAERWWSVELSGRCTVRELRLGTGVEALEVGGGGA